MTIDYSISASSLAAAATRVFDASAPKLHRMLTTWDLRRGAPVITVRGAYEPRGWTEWTLGFHFGSSLLQYEATGDIELLELGREGILASMTPHLTHVGIHDHGFHIVSTFGNLLRLAAADDAAFTNQDALLYRQALCVSGAVQAARWTRISDDSGYIHSFNGPHSLFVDTIRTLRSLAIAHGFGQHLSAESDTRISLFHRLLLHAECTAAYNVYYGNGRDAYDERGRTAHEAVFNVTDGSYRCPATHQGYSPFSTWTRGLAWAICGFAEQLPFLASRRDDEYLSYYPKETALRRFEEAARATADYYIENSAADGIPYWDTGAPGMQALGDWRHRSADPFNAHEPVDSSAAAIAAQGLLRLGEYLGAAAEADAARLYTQAGLSIAARLFGEPYLSSDQAHDGLLLHVVYHRPKCWDYVPPGSRIPRGESAQWGDYHLRELALCVLRLGQGAELPRFDEGFSTAAEGLQWK